MKTSRMAMWVGLCLWSFVASSAVSAAPLDLAIKAEMLDESTTSMWRDGEVVPDAANQLHSVLGVTNVVPSYIVA
jgi:hypothetical protein